jgi:hypothetical protein
MASGGHRSARARPSARKGTSCGERLRVSGVGHARECLRPVPPSRMRSVPARVSALRRPRRLFPASASPTRNFDRSCALSRAAAAAISCSLKTASACVAMPPRELRRRGSGKAPADLPTARSSPPDRVRPVLRSALQRRKPVMTGMPMGSSRSTWRSLTTPFASNAAQSSKEPYRTLLSACG